MMVTRYFTRVVMVILSLFIGAVSQAQTPSVGDVSLTFEREANGAFQTIVRPVNPGQQFDNPPQFSTSRGTMSEAVMQPDGSVQVVITPDSAFSGEYHVQAEGMLGGAPFTIARTAVVLPDVADGWGQPAAVEGLVNTPAWEDSAAISPDGEWLFIEYLPVTINCYMGQNQAVFCDTARGSVSAPERPNMPGADRVVDGKIRQACPGIGVDPAPFPIPPQALYGFHRQPDGTFAEPFPIYLENGDGCFSPFGPSVRLNGDGTARMYLAFAGENDQNRLWYVDFILGEPLVLGRLTAFTDHPVVEDSIMHPVDAPSSAPQGNPHVYDAGGGVLYVFWDTETQAESERRIYVSVYDGKTWSAEQRLGFETDGKGEIQPYFDGMQLIVRQGNDLVSYPYTGSSPLSLDSWGKALTLLGVGTPSLQVGSIVSLGEPTIAVRDGKSVLYFVYAVYEADQSLNLNVGFVESQ